MQSKRGPTLTGWQKSLEKSLWSGKVIGYEYRCIQYCYEEVVEIGPLRQPVSPYAGKAEASGANRSS